MSLTQIVDLAIKHHLPLIGAGDLFDKRNPTPSIVALVQQQMVRMSDEELPVYFITGQHCRRPDMSLEDVEWLSVSTERYPPTHIHKQVVRIGDEFTAYGLDWTPSTSLTEAFSGIPAECNLFIGHQVWKELRSNESITYEASLLQLPPNIKTVITGDWHKHWQGKIEDPDNDRTLHVLSAGSIAAQDVSETARKSVFILHEHGEITSVPLKTRHMVTVALDDSVSDEAVREAIDNAIETSHDQLTTLPLIAQPLVLIRHVVADRKRARALVHTFNERAVMRTQVIAAGAADMPETAVVDYAGRLSFAQAATAVSQNKEAIDLAVALHNSNDPTAVLAQFKPALKGQ